MVFDMRTLIVFAGACHLLFAVLMAAYWSLRRDDRALAIWAVSNFVGAFGWLLIGLRGHVPDWASIAAGNALLQFDLMLIWAGTRAFTGRRIPWPVVVSPAVIILALFTVVPWVRDDVGHRVVAVNIALLLALVLVAVDASRDRRVENLRARRIVLLALLGAVVANITRAVLSANLTPGADFLGRNEAQEVGMFVFCLAPLAWNIGLLLMSRERLENELHQIARTDPLTSLYNRAGFAELAQREIGRRSHAQPTASVLVMDLDEFKYVNDTFGHIAGDRLLSALAERVKAALRPEDVVARFGGDEFCALLPCTSLAEGQLIAERVRSAVEGLVIEIGDVQISTTISVGVAEVAAGSDDVYRTLAVADDALYRAKRQGPNRVAS